MQTLNILKRKGINIYNNVGLIIVKKEFILSLPVSTHRVILRILTGLFIVLQHNSVNTSVCIS